MKTISFRLSILATIPGYTTRGQTLRSPNTWLQHGDKRNRKNYKSKSNLFVTSSLVKTHQKNTSWQYFFTILKQLLNVMIVRSTSMQRKWVHNCYNNHVIDCTRFQHSLRTLTVIFSVSSSVFYSSPSVSLWVCSLTQGHPISCLPLYPALQISWMERAPCCACWNGTGTCPQTTRLCYSSAISSFHHNQTWHPEQTKKRLPIHVNKQYDNNFVHHSMLKHYSKWVLLQSRPAPPQSTINIDGHVPYDSAPFVDVSLISLWPHPSSSLSSHRHHCLCLPLSPPQRCQQERTLPLPFHHFLASRMMASLPCLFWTSLRHPRQLSSLPFSFAVSLAAPIEQENHHDTLQGLKRFLRHGIHTFFPYFLSSLSFLDFSLCSKTFWRLSRLSLTYKIMQRLICHATTYNWFTFRMWSSVLTISAK